jgi:hypothetical protein
MTESPGDEDPLISADAAALIAGVSRQRWHILLQTDPDAPPGEDVKGADGSVVRRVWRQSAATAYRTLRDARGAGSEPADEDADRSSPEGA